MTTLKIRFPYVIRELVPAVEQLLDLALGIPMEFEYKPGRVVREAQPDQEEAEVIAAKARIFWAGGLCAKFLLEAGSGHYGEWHDVRSLKVTRKFDTQDEALEWVETVEKYAGPLNAKYEDHKISFVLEGSALERLQVNASHRRNGLAVYLADDPESPTNLRLAGTSATAPQPGIETEPDGPEEK